MIILLHIDYMVNHMVLFLMAGGEAGCARSARSGILAQGELRDHFPETIKGEWKCRQEPQGVLHDLLDGPMPSLLALYLASLGPLVR